MEQMKYLELFRKEVMRLRCDNVNELSKVGVSNTQKYSNHLEWLCENLLKEGKLNHFEDQYLIEIRKLWLHHMELLATVRNVYSDSKYQKLERPTEFNDIDVPAFAELTGSSTPTDNSFIVLDENQHVYWQYLEVASKIELPMMLIDWYFSHLLGIVPNFNFVTDAQSGESSLESYKILREFMTEFVVQEKKESVQEKDDIEEAGDYIKKILDNVYREANDKYYEWLVNSILHFRYSTIKIPDIGQDGESFVIPYTCHKSELYKKIRAIKKEIYPAGKGREYLANIFYNSAKNLRNGEELDLDELKKRI